MQRCTEAIIDVIANDTDPDGDAITLTGITGSGTHGTPWLYGDGASIDYFAGSTLGTDTITYTIQDSHGATATGTLTVIVNGACEG